eukprot:3199399-Pleurochrysis_carterae.AAC.1
MQLALPLGFKFWTLMNWLALFPCCHKRSCASVSIQNDWKWHAELTSGIALGTHIRSKNDSLNVG